jgi:hypothetical protein
MRSLSVGAHEGHVGEDVMKIAFMIMPLALVLSACTDANTVENLNSCKRVLSAQEAQMVFAHSISADGSVLLGPTIPKLGAEQENKRNQPQLYDLHKVGHVQPILSVVLSANVDDGTLVPNDEVRLIWGVTG